MDLLARRAPRRPARAPQTYLRGERPPSAPQTRPRTADLLARRAPSERPADPPAPQGPTCAASALRAPGARTRAAAIPTTAAAAAAGCAAPAGAPVATLGRRAHRRNAPCRVAALQYRWIDACGSMGGGQTGLMPV
eukprot:134573-Chlamydomonas_euryale.AAC.1